MKLRDFEIQIINSHVGEMDSKALENLFLNIDYYLNEKMCVFVPLYNYCHYAVMPNHTHNSYSFIIYINNNDDSYLKVDGKDIKVPKIKNNMLAAFSPEVMHQEVIREGFSSYYALFINVELFEKTFKNYGYSDIPKFTCNFYEVGEAFMQSVKLFMSECKSDLPQKEKLLEIQIQNIVHRIIRILVLNDTSAEIYCNRDDVNRSVSYIYKNISSKISVEELALQANLSVSQFNRVFKQYVKMTPNEYIRYVRLERAKILLKESSSDLTTIALECGFSSSSYFSHCFIESEGITPKIYRDRYFE